jgi:hypothetical protein
MVSRTSKLTILYYFVLPELSKIINLIISLFIINNEYREFYIKKQLK